MNGKILFLIPDGMGDWPVEALGGKTPLGAASTPHMDALAARGLLGTCRTVPEGMPPGSDVANMALLGFDPAAYHTGRGPIEAAAQGLELEPTDLVWRMNLVTASEKLMLDYSSAHIDSSVSRPLVETMQKELGNEMFTFVPGIQYRHLLIQKNGVNAPEAELEIRPPHDITDQEHDADLSAYAASPFLAALRGGAAEILERDGGGEGKHAATDIWPWGQGAPLTMPPFAEQFGLKGAVVSAVDLVRGLGRAARMEVLEVEGVTGLIDTNYEGKVEAAARFLEAGGDFVYVHVEAPDECGHGGDADEKAEAIRRFDERIVGPLVERFPDAAFMIACDHLTPIEIRTHAPDPVPFLLACPGLLPGHGESVFTEETAASTGLRIDKGDQLLPWVQEVVASARAAAQGEADAEEGEQA